MFDFLKRFMHAEKRMKESATIKLLEVLNESENICLRDVLDHITSELPVCHNVEETDIQHALGRALALAAVVQSGIINKSPENGAKTVIKDLMRLRRRRDEAADVSVCTLVRLIELASPEVFDTYIWPKIEGVLSLGWADCTPDRLTLLLASVTSHNNPGLDTLCKSWNDGDIIAAGNYTNILTLLQTLPKPDMVLLNSITRYVFTSGSCKVKSFWSAVAAHLLDHKLPKYQDIAFAMIHCGFSHAKQIKHVLCMLSPTFFSCLRKRYTIAGKNINQEEFKIIANMLNNLSRKVISSPDPAMLISVVEHVLDHLEHKGFDEETHSKTLSVMIHNLSSDDAKTVSEKFQTILSSDSKSKNLRLWALSQLTGLLTIPSIGTDTSFQTSLLCYFISQSLFVHKETPSMLDSQICNSCLLQLYKSLDHLSTYKPVNARRDPLIYINQVYRVASFVQKSLGSAELTVVESIGDGALQEWQSMYKLAHKIHKKLKGEKLNQNHAFLLLILHLGLQLFNESSQAIPLLKDVYRCYEKADTKRQMLRKHDPDSECLDEPEWLDVVTEVLVSLLCQASHLSRKITQSVYAILHESITLSSVEILLNVLVPEDEDSDVLFVNDGNEVNGSDDEIDDSCKRSDDDSGVEDDAVPVDVAFRQSVAAALGPAARVDDEGEAEDADDGESDRRSDMSDETMIRLDSTLSEVFRSQFKNKKETKQKSEQITNLKFRVMELLEVITHSSTLASGPVLVTLLKPLLILMEDKGADGNTSTLAVKSHKVYFSIIEHKQHIMKSPVEDMDELLTQMAELVHFSTTSKRADLVNAVAKGYMLLVSWAIGYAKDRDSEAYKQKHMKVFDQLRSLLSDCLRKPESNLREQFFKKLIDLQRNVMWPLSTTLIDCCRDLTLKVYKRTQAGLMLSDLITKSIRSSIPDSEWEDFKTKVADILNTCVSAMKATDLRPKLLYTLLNISYKCQLQDANLTQLFLPDVIQKLDTLQPNMNNDCKKLWNRLKLKNSTPSGKNTLKTRKRKTKQYRDGAGSKKAKTQAQSA